MVATRTETHSLPVKRKFLIDEVPSAKGPKPRISKPKKISQDEEPARKDPKPTTKKESTPKLTTKKSSTRDAETVDLVSSDSILPDETQQNQSIFNASSDRQNGRRRSKLLVPSQGNPTWNFTALPTPIFDLPPELRNEIYAYVLGPSHKVQVGESRPFVLEPKLLRISRQIRSEALPIWWGESIFEVDGSSPAVKFMRAISDEQLRSLRTLRIQVTILQSIEVLKLRIRGLMREFEPRGLSRQAIYFEAVVGGVLEWSNLKRLKQLEKEGCTTTKVR